MLTSKTFSFDYIFPIILFVLVFNNCEQKPSTTETVVNLTYWSSSNPLEIKLAENLVLDWNNSNPTIQVTLKPLPAELPAEEIILRAIKNGTAPDVCSNMWPGFVPTLVEVGGLIAVDRFDDFDEVVRARTPIQMIHSLRYKDGHIYEVPWKGNPIMLQYNTRLINEAGVTLPLKYSGFLNAAKKLTRDTNGDGQIDRWMLDPSPTDDWFQRFFDFYAFYIAASGGQTLFNGNDIDFENSAAVEVFRFWENGYSNSYFPKTIFTYDAFLNEEIAFNITGPWNIAYADKNKRDDFEYDFTPIPVPDNYEGPVYTYRDVKDITIFSNTSNPREAWEFVKFMISKKNDLLLLELCSQVPLRKDLLIDPDFSSYLKSNSYMEKFVAQARYTKSVDQSPYLKDIFEIISHEFTEGCIDRVKTPEQALADAASKVNQLLADENNSN